MDELVVGTAGHIDHGKTALVAALTGVDCDRLAEEKRRRMTIELGFASWDLPSGRQVSVVDVPGHERFLRTMAMGARSIDLALFCVAVDDGVMPQSREHAAVLRVLRARGAVVAVTKCDLAWDRAPVVGEQATALLQGLGISTTGWCPVSVHPPTGLEALAAAVDSALATVSGKLDRGIPRLFVDRSFQVRGQGTVVTGSLQGGRLSVGGEVALHPSGAVGRISGMQRRNRPCQEADGGRLALALRGITLAQAPRGSVLGLPSDIRPTSTADCLFEVPGSGATGLRQGMNLDVLAGSATTGARLWLAGEGQLQRDRQGYGQLQLSKPQWLLPGDRLLLRAPSPAAVLGGALVLEAEPPPHRRWSKAALEGWSTRLHVLEERGPSGLATVEARSSVHGISVEAAARRAGVSAALAAEELERALSQGQLIQIGGSLVSPEVALQVAARAAEVLRDAATSKGVAQGLSKSELAERLGLESAAIDGWTQFFAARGLLEYRRALVVAPGTPALPSRSAAADRSAALLRSAGTRVADAESLRQAGLTREVAKYLEHTGEAVRLGSDLLLAPEALAELESRLQSVLEAHPEGLTVAEIRDYLGGSRRVVIPLLERAAKQRRTVRRGDRHLLVPRS